MAEVWRSEAHFPDGHVEHVAIKRALPDLASSPLYQRMLEDEARIGMLLRHPNIVRVYDARMLHGSFVIVMELVEGASLREVLRHAQASGARMPLAAALHVARELARALECAHQAVDEWGRELGIVHRDVSPHNVLLSERGEVKLMDFGLAHCTANLAEQDAGTLGGKLGYLSPEVVLRHEISPALDLFALGVILWEALMGQRLFQGRTEEDTVRRLVRCQVPSVSATVAGVPGELDQLLQVLLAREPGERHASAADLGAELEYLLLRYGRGRGEIETAQLVHALRGRRAPMVTVESGSRSISRSGAQPVAGRAIPHTPVHKLRS
jgi:serine/threonine protein kinase